MSCLESFLAKGNLMEEIPKHCLYLFSGSWPCSHSNLQCKHHTVRMPLIPRGPIRAGSSFRAGEDRGTRSNTLCPRTHNLSPWNSSCRGVREGRQRARRAKGCIVPREERSPAALGAPCAGIPLRSRSAPAEPRAGARRGRRSAR